MPEPTNEDVVRAYTWRADGTVTYPDGSTWFYVVLLEIHDRKVYRETEYFAAPFEAPAWRRPYVERMDREGPR